MMFGKKRNEFKLFDDLNFKTYHYDCYIPKYKILIEYNGSAFHYHESFPDDWASLYGCSKEESIRLDECKRVFAENSGYKVLYVWDFEVSSKNRTYKKIKELVNEIKETMV